MFAGSFNTHMLQFNKCWILKVLACISISILYEEVKKYLVFTVYILSLIPILLLMIGFVFRNLFCIDVLIRRRTECQKLLNYR